LITKYYVQKRFGGNKPSEIAEEPGLRIKESINNETTSDKFVAWTAVNTPGIGQKN